MEAANNRNISIAILDKNIAPAKQINATNPGVDGSFSDPKAIRKLAAQCDILTIEIEHVDTHVLEELEQETEAQGKRLEIHPSWQCIRTIQDKYLQKLTLIEGKVGVAKSVPISSSSEAELQEAAEELGLPFMLKARTGAYDGRGNYPVRSTDDFKSALKALKDRPLYAEQWANFTKELAVMVVKTADLADPDNWESSTLSYPTVETIHQDSICKLVYAPAREISEEINLRAQQLARRAVANFKGKGVFGVEMFLLPDNTIKCNEIAPRKHNSGHFTMEACRLSQYDTHLLAILGRPIPKKGLELLKPAIMLNILGGSDPTSYLQLANAADSIGAKVHLYGKGAATPGRKMGHLTLLGDTMSEAEVEIAPLIHLSDTIRKSPAPPQPPKPSPLIGITTGSASDQPILEPCYALLRTLNIPFSKNITSAHRTPHYMAQYAHSASSPTSSIKVIIAAAGGAAHLPGMLASYAPTVPVIGLPIKPSIGDGMDSLLSMTNMPNGRPVLTVGTNKAMNAALAAASILAVEDEGIRKRLEAWYAKAESESLASDRRLVEEDEGNGS